MAQDDDLLEEIREHFRLAMDAWREIREEGKTDMRHVAGDPWKPKDRIAREGAGRVCLSLDELGQYFNQVINDVRANPRAIKFAPVGNGANDAAAEFYQNKTREIEYRSHAQVAYTTAFQNAVERSYGWVRVNTKFLPKSFNQDLWIEDVPNPDLVLPDPNATRPDSSDMKYLFYYELWQQADFKREYPKAKIQDFGGFLANHPLNDLGLWIQDKTIVLAEYWRVNTEERELIALQMPDGSLQEVYSDEMDKMPDKGIVANRRSDQVQTVTQYLTNGCEILKESKWAGKYIPFVSCFGKMIYVDDGSGSKRKILSMTRLARDPYMLYCYYRTCEAELVGMTPKFPYFVRRGSLTPAELLNLQKSLHEPIAVVQVEGSIDTMPGGAPPEFPMRQPYEPPIQALAIGAEEARRAIQAAMGSNFMPTQAQRKNEKSGKALQQIESSSQKGTYHFIDHYNDLIRQTGIVLEDLMDKIYDTARDVGVRLPNDTSKNVRINDANPQNLPPEQEQPIETKGDYLVTVSSGPSYDSERQAASDFIDQVANLPGVFPLIGPMLVKLKNLGPIGDEIAKALELLQPPALKQQKPGQGPDPAQMQQQLQKFQQMVQALTQELNAKNQVIETDQVKGNVEIEKAKIDQQTRITVAGIQAEAAISSAEIKAGLEDFRLRLGHMEALIGMQADAHSEAADRAHEVGINALDHQQALEAGQQQADNQGQLQAQQAEQQQTEAQP